MSSGVWLSLCELGHPIVRVDGGAVVAYDAAGRAGLYG